MTSRIYYTDPVLPPIRGCRDRSAFEHEGRPAALLDRTAFYPTSGGQPFDTGNSLGRVRRVGRVRSMGSGAEPSDPRST